MHYLDNAATTQVAPEVIEVISGGLWQVWGNPSSLYTAGMEAEQQLDAARKTVAKAMGCQPKEVHFTGGGSEGTNIALLGAALARRAWGKELVATGYEHPCVAGPLALLAEKAGYTLRVIPPGRDGRVSPEALADAVGPHTAVVAAMQVNNETGAIIDVAALAAAVKKKNPRCFVMVDGVQGFCKQPLMLKSTAIDGYAVTGHKLHGPKGVGALFLKSGSHILPPFTGGGQEGGIRPGTENVPLIMGFAKAVDLAFGRMQATEAHTAALRNQLQEGLDHLGGFTIHSPADGVSGILFFSMPKGLRSQIMLNHLDQRFDVCVSSGSACAGGSGSHTLAAMGVPEEEIDAALRVSFCGETSPEDVATLLTGLEDGMAKLARR